MDQSPAIRVRQLRKLYGNKPAVDGLDLEVPRGSFFGFLGPNGAGKTTTIRMLMGLAPPTSGEIELLGLAMPAAPARPQPTLTFNYAYLGHDITSLAILAPAMVVLLIVAYFVLH